MKRLLLAVCCLLFLSVGFVPTASAHGWWWHRHKKDSAANAGSSNPKKEKHHRDKGSHESSAPLQSGGPRSVGWWHKQPGPAGAGS